MYKTHIQHLHEFSPMSLSCAFFLFVGYFYGQTFIVFLLYLGSCCACVSVPHLLRMTFDDQYAKPKLVKKLVKISAPRLNFQNV